MSAGALIAVVYLLIVNLACYGLFAADKWQARRGGPRVPEARLLWAVAMGGGLGAKIGQHRLRHKTRKQPFGRRVNTILLLQAAALAGFAALPERMTESEPHAVMPRRFGPGS